MVRPCSFRSTASRLEKHGSEANALNFDQVLAAIEQQRRTSAELLGAFSDADLRGEIDLFGSESKPWRGHREHGPRRVRRLPDTVVHLP